MLRIEDTSERDRVSEQIVVGANKSEPEMTKRDAKEERDRESLLSRGNPFFHLDWPIAGRKGRGNAIFIPTDTTL
jgi:hypothetical protein